jgi:hypothetical protein
MRTPSFVLTALVLGATALTAQTKTSAFELRPFAGATIPTGALRDVFKDAPILGMGVAFQMQPNLHIVGNFGWMREHTKYAVSKNDGNRYSYDAGVELSAERAMTENWMFRPYVGLGAGARTYTYQAETLLKRTGAAGYGTLGTEFRYGVTAIRLEARGNAFNFKSPLPDAQSTTRYDIAFSLGMAYHF